MSSVLELTVLQAGSGSGAPVNTVAPAVTGTATVGQTLTSSSGSWTGNVSGGFSYQWKDASGNISGATSTTYVIGSGEATRSIHCTVTAVGTGGNTAANSNTVGPVGNRFTPTLNPGKFDVCANDIIPLYTAPLPTNLVLPLIAGAQHVGSPLVCSTGTWAGNPTSFSYQWLTNGSIITAATASTYTSVGDDIGAAITCRVTASNTGGDTTVTSSNSIVVTGGGVGVFSSNPSLRVFSTPNPRLAVFDS